MEGEESVSDFTHLKSVTNALNKGFETLALSMYLS